jgi:Rieske Fe-S protein
MRGQLKNPGPTAPCIFLDGNVRFVEVWSAGVRISRETAGDSIRHDYCRSRPVFDKERHVTTRQPEVPNVIAVSPEEAPGPTRRQFCAHACQAASLVAVGALLPACGGGDGNGNPTSPTPTTNTPALAVVNGSVSGRTVSVSVTGSLGSAGSAALVNAPLQPPASFLVFRNSQTSFTVLTALCTHEGCTVDRFNGQLFECPCHGSRYTTTGTVANGPANRALTSFPATLSGDTLTFTT